MELALSFHPQENGINAQILPTHYYLARRAVNPLCTVACRPAREDLAMSAPADRALVSLCIDCAARINRDSSAATVIADADALLQWLEARLRERAARDPMRDAHQLIDANTGLPVATIHNPASELNDLLSRDAGGNLKADRRTS